MEDTETIEAGAGTVASSSPVSLSLTEAGEACSTSKSTIRRRLEAGKFPNAFREGGTDDGQWMIPVPDLIAAGFSPNSPVEIIDLTGDTPKTDDSLTHKLELELANERGKTERWRAVADERDRTIQGFERVMRLLPTASSTEAHEMPAASAASVKPEPVTDPPPRRRWFRRQDQNAPKMA